MQEKQTIKLSEKEQYLQDWRKKHKVFHDSKQGAQRELSIEERLFNQEISAVEKASLDTVFDLLCGKQSTKGKKTNQNSQGLSNDNQQEKDYFTTQEVLKVLTDLEYKATSQEVEQMIWEIDEDLNGQINKYEFELMYKRCSKDPTSLEPKTLYNVVQFLMFLKKPKNKSSSENGDGFDDWEDDIQDNKTKLKITVEDTLGLLYVRYGREKMDKEIEEIFGNTNINQNGQERQVSLTEFLQNIKKKDYRRRKAMQAKQMDLKPKDEPQNDDYYYEHLNEFIPKGKLKKLML